MKWSMQLKRACKLHQKVLQEGVMEKSLLLMGLYHPLDGITNLKYKLLYFLTPNKKFQREWH